MGNFLFFKEAQASLGKFDKGKNLLNAITNHKYINLLKNMIKIICLDSQTNMGYNLNNVNANNDLIFTAKFIKQMKEYVNTSFVRLMLNLINGEINAKKQKEMYCLDIPGTHKQKIIHFAIMDLKETPKKIVTRKAAVLIEIADAFIWHNHGQIKSYKLEKKAKQRINYYSPIYGMGIKLLEQIKTVRK